MTDSLPVGWKTSRLDQVAETRLGKMLSPASRRGSSPVHYLRNINVRWGHVETADVLSMDFDPHEIEKFKLLPGDVLICEGGEPGRAAVWEEQLPGALFQKALHRVRPDASQLDPYFLVYHLRWDSLAGGLSSYFTGSTIKHFTGVALKRYELRLPDPEEQRRLVQEIEKQFTKLDVAVAALHRVKLKLKRYRNSILQTSMSGEWPWTTLGEMAARITKGTTPTSLGHSYTTAGVLFVKAESLRGGWIDHSMCAHIDESADAALSRSRLKVDDVLFSIAGTLGRTAIVRESDLPGNTNQAVSIIRPIDVRHSRYLRLFLSSPIVLREIEKQKRGVGLNNLNLGQVASLRVALPPLMEQERIATEVERHLSIIDELDQDVDANLKRADGLRQAILELAFSGQIVSSAESNARTLNSELGGK